MLGQGCATKAACKLAPLFPGGGRQTAPAQIPPQPSAPPRINPSVMESASRWLGKMCEYDSRRRGGMRPRGNPTYVRSIFARGPALPRRQHHDHLPPLEAGVHLDLGDFFGVTLEAIEKPDAKLLVGHFAAAEPQRHLDLVAFLEEALHRAHLHLVVMIVDHWPELDFLDLDHLLLLAGFRLLLLFLVLELAEIQELADRRSGVGGDLDEVEARLLGERQCLGNRNRAAIGTILVDQMNLAFANIIIDARTVLGNGQRGSHRAT